MPFSIKDAIDTAGVPTKRGSKIFENFTPEKDATVVTRMKNAGAIPLMKTNIPEFSAHWESDNLVTCRSNNPWNLDRTPGGSSGGESAATAKLLEEAGCEVEEVRLPFMENTDWLTPYFNVVYGELIPYMGQFTKGLELEMHPIGKATMDYPLLSARDYAKAEAKTEELRMYFAGYFQQYDVLLCPVNPMTATGHMLNEYVVNGKTVSPYHVMAATALLA